MRILLDTHVVLWWLQDNRKLSKRNRARIRAASAVYVSSVTNLDPLASQIELDGFLELGISHYSELVELI